MTAFVFTVTSSLPVCFNWAMVSRAADWFRQAERDLIHARDSQRAASHDWACFAAQQAGEKALKALHLHLGQEAWGRVVAALIEELPEQVKVREAVWLPT